MKIALLTILATASLFAVDGYEVYKKHCMSCHIEMITKKKTLKKFNTLLAPPMIEVANRLDQNIIIADDDDDVKRFVTISFIKEYIKNPKLDYSMCHPMAIEKLGIMPAQKQLSDAESTAVAEWIVDRYEGSEF